MIQYVVKTGDKLSKIIFSYQTTRPILANINPGVNLENLSVGMTLNIESKEDYFKRTANKVTEVKQVSNVIANAFLKQVSAVKLNDDSDDVDDDVKGIIRFNSSGYIYQISANNKLDKKTAAKVGQRYNHYGFLDAHGGLYILSGQNRYARAADIVHADVPSATYNVGKTNTQDRKEATTVIPDFPQFDMVGYRRTRLKVKGPDGKFITIELRVTSFTPNYTNQFTPSRTNAGWMLAVGGESLLNITITGFWLDTVANTEARDFNRFYKDYLVPKNGTDYFSSEIVSLVHKSWEYKGVIQSFSMQDSAETPLDRKFQMQFLSLSDRAISREEQVSKYKNVVMRGAVDSRETEKNFLSNLTKMLSNPLNGAYYVDPE